jgi:hypothetical protein
MRNSYKSLVDRPEGKRRRWKDYIKIDLKRIEYECVNWFHLAQDKVHWRASCCEQDNGLSVS